ncbi:hypothetical protein JCM2811A_42270 [Methylorubrum rhodinum]
MTVAPGASPEGASRRQPDPAQGASVAAGIAYGKGRPAASAWRCPTVVPAAAYNGGKFALI